MEKTSMLKSFGKIRVATEPVIEDANGTKVVKFRGSSSELVKSDTGEKKYYNHYFDFVAWGSAAEYISNNCPKGTDMFVEAIARENRWTTNEGQNRSKTFYRLQTFYVLQQSARREDIAEVASDTISNEESPF